MWKKQCSKFQPLNLLITQKKQMVFVLCWTNTKQDPFFGFQLDTQQLFSTSFPPSHLLDQGCDEVLHCEVCSSHRVSTVESSTGKSGNELKKVNGKSLIFLEISPGNQWLRLDLSIWTPSRSEYLPALKMPLFNGFKIGHVKVMILFAFDKVSLILMSWHLNPHLDPSETRWSKTGP